MMRALCQFASHASVLVPLVLFGCHGTPKLEGPMSEDQARSFRTCTSDAQCVYALNGCCDCANGGNDFAVARTQLDAFRAQFECGGACSEVGADCARGTVVCEQGLCAYRAPAK